jgi:predicted PurR-regulated permease PerM
MNWQETPFYVKVTVKLLLLALIITIMVVASYLLIPLLIALLFAFLLLPVSRGLVRIKIPHAAAIILSIIFAIIVFGGLIYFILMQVESFVEELPTLREKMFEKWNVIQQFIYEQFRVTSHEQIRWINRQVNANANAGQNFVIGLFSATGSFLASLALIPIYIFLLTYYKSKFKTFILLITGGKSKEGDEYILAVLKKISTVSQKYLKGLMLDVLILSVLNSTGFLMLGLDHAILFGVVASLLNIVPYIGVLVGSLLPITMALLTHGDFSYVLAVAAVPVFVQFLDNNFITPYVLGSSVSLNPLTAVIALIAGAMIWGMPGMILCMPVVGMIKVICDHVDELKPYGYIIGEETDFEHKRSKHKELIQKMRIKKNKK